MGTSVVVDRDNFITDVLQQSFEKPVLVDFFATWCGPCQMLKPMLEKLVKEYDFVLAKIDIDQNPELAHEYGVEGVPDVRVVVQGEVMNGFVGVLPEPKLRDLLTQLKLKSELEMGLEAIHVARVAGDVDGAKQLFETLTQKYPENRKLMLEAARFLISQKSLDSAEKALSVIQEDEKEFFAEAQAIRALIQFNREVENPVLETELDQAYVAAVKRALAGDYETAFHAFLDIVKRDRKYRNDGARKAMITLFGLLGDDHPLTKEYRKQLMQALY
jgi:putative thioredoxin